MNIFDVNTPFFQFLNKLSDVILLGLLWLACCIPVVTIGASTTAYVSVLMDMQRNLEGNIYHQFKVRFRSYFKRSTVTWITILAILGWLAFDIYLCRIVNTTVSWFFFPILVILGVLFIQAYAYTWALIPTSSQPLITLWKAALKISIAYLPHSLSIVALALLCIFVVSYLPWTSLLAPPLIFYQYARIFVWIFIRDARFRKVVDLWDEGVDQGPQQP